MALTTPRTWPRRWWPTRPAATLSSGTYSLQANGFRYVLAASSGGGDTATLQDSAGNDTFDAYPTYAQEYAGTYLVRATGFAKVDGQSRQGADLARLYGSSQADTFTASSTSGHLTGTGFDSGAENFRYCLAYANGGSDTATMYPANAADTYVGTAAYGVAYGANYYDRAIGFPHVEVDAAAGSGATARLYDSPGNDVFTAGPTSATMTETGAVHVVKNFRNVLAYATSGGTDTATLTAALGDSQHFNILDANPTYTSLSGTAGSGYYDMAAGFATVTAISLGNATDIARLHDSAGSDTFTASPATATVAATATLIGSGFAETANSFTNVYAYGGSGGTDVANLYGSSGNDTFTGTPTSARLSGTNYIELANNFAQVHAVAGLGGTDVANFVKDSAGNASFWGHAADAVLSDGTLDSTSGNLVTPNTYYNEASGFGSASVAVTAGGTSGTNTRKILTPLDYTLASFTGTWVGDPWP